MSPETTMAPSFAPKGAERGLPELIRQLSRATSLEQIMSLVSEGVRNLLQADGATFVLRDGERCLYGDEDAISPLWKGRRFPLNACVSGWCMLNRKPVAIADIYADDRVFAEAYRPTFVRSLAMAPVGEEEPVAVLGAYWGDVRQPSPAEVKLLQAIADATALALRRLPLRDAAQRPPSGTNAHRLRPASPWADLVDRLEATAVRPNSWRAYLFAGLCVLGAILLREAANATGLRGLVPFSTFYPAVLLAMLVGGTRAGVLAAILGGLGAQYLFVAPLRPSVPFTAADALNLGLYGGACVLIVLIVDRYKRMVVRLKSEDAEHLTLAREQNHRLLNAAHIAELIVGESLKDDPVQARIINQRIRAGLAEVGIAARAATQPITLRALLDEELAPFGRERIALVGSDALVLPAKLRTVVSLAGHELATNAVKHGALSRPDGRVSIRWRVEADALRLTWRESGGPKVQPPTRQGYGFVMLRRLVAAAGGALRTDFRAAGLVAEISLPRPAARAAQATKLRVGPRAPAGAEPARA